MSKNILTHKVKHYSQFYDIAQAERFYNLYNEAKKSNKDISYNKIAMDTKLNPKRLSPQRIGAIIKEYETKLNNETGGDNNDNQ